MANYYYGLTFHSVNERKEFVDKVYEEMRKRDITIKELSEMVGYSNKSVYQFLSDTSIANKFLAASLADKLEIR